MGNYFPMHEGARRPLPYSGEVSKAWAELKQERSVWTEPFTNDPPNMTRTFNESTGNWEFYRTGPDVRGYVEDGEIVFNDRDPAPIIESVARNIPGNHEYVDGLDYKELIAYLNGVLQGLKAAGEI